MIATSRAEAQAQDGADPLAGAREAFVLPEGLIYLDGHSLGPATRAALERVGQALERDWAQGLIRSWNDAGWMDLPVQIGARLAQLIGANAEEVIVCDSVSVNLFKLAAAALPLARDRLLLVEEDEFPTDQYVMQGLADLVGARFGRVAGGAGRKALADRGGVLIRSVVNYRTAQAVDITAYETTARDSGGVIVWDLSHATGVLDLDLGACGARLAAGCTYKFLNGGPGAPAFIYARGDIAEQMRSPLAGWMGHAAPFAFEADYTPKAAAARFAAGTPGILSLAALSGALNAFEGIDRSALAVKARALGDLCLALAARLGLPSISPKLGSERGGHISLVHPEGYAVVQALIARGIIADFRAPDAMRFGFSPLFVRYVDVWDAMTALGDVLKTRAWDQPAFLRRAAVT